jgi:hypothetical protein
MRAFAIALLMAEIKTDLETMGVHIDVYSSERALVESGAVDRAFQELLRQGLIYQGRLDPPKGQKPDDWEDREQTLFRATLFGDEVDRPLKKSDGGWTYFANDIAYHHDKYRRGFGDMIDVWGADHGGYVKRMKAAVSAITERKGELDVKLCQLVRVMRNGELVRMSKRAGTVRHIARPARRGRTRCRAVHHADPQERRAVRLRPRQGHRTVTRQPGVVRPVRACALPQRHAPGERRRHLGRRVGRCPARPSGRCRANARWSARSRNGRVRSRPPPWRTNPIASPSTSTTSPPPFHAHWNRGATSLRCASSSSRTPSSRARAWRWYRRSVL